LIAWLLGLGTRQILRLRFKEQNDRQEWGDCSSVNRRGGGGLGAGVGERFRDSFGTYDGS